MLPSAAAYPLTVSPHPASPELSSSPYAGLSIQKECPETPSPASRRPLGSPGKQLNGSRMSLFEDRIDPTLLRIAETGRELSSDFTTSNSSSSVHSKDSAAEEEHPKKEENLKKKPMKQFTATESSYQTDKKRQDTAFRNMGERLKEGLRKMGVVTNCYGILLIDRDDLFSH